MLLGPSMPHGRAKVVVEGWVSRMRRRIRERTRMRGRARVAVGDGRGSSNSRRVQVSAWSWRWSGSARLPELGRLLSPSRTIEGDAMSG